MATFTARELEILALVHQCFSSDPKVDYEKLATLGGFKNKASANAVWGAIKKKVATHATNGAASTTAATSTSTTSTTATQTTPAKRKKPATKPTTDDGEAASLPKRGRPATKAKGANGTKATKATKGANGKGGLAKAEPAADAAGDEEALREEEEAEMVRAEERELVGNLVKKEPEIEGEDEIDGEIDWEVEQKRFLNGE